MKRMNTSNMPVIATIGAAVAILTFLWTLQSDIADLRERMARLEGSFTVIAQLLVDERNEARRAD